MNSLFMSQAIRRNIRFSIRKSTPNSEPKQVFCNHSLWQLSNIVMQTFAA